MKLASADVIVWAIIAIVVAIGKGLGKLSSSREAETNDEPAPPPPLPARLPRPASSPAIRRAAEQRIKTYVRPGLDEPQRQAPPRDFRDLLEQLSKPPVQARPIPPKAVAAPAPVPRRESAKSEVEPKPAPTPPQPSETSMNHSTPWTAALRDRSNLRNIIIAAEIIGPPRGA